MVCLSAAALALGVAEWNSVTIWVDWGRVVKTTVGVGVSDDVDNTDEELEDDSEVVEETLKRG